ncbi:GNAT family N-acetyltransferase [Ectobacillus polymachus]|uniref:GNAT family N-acetyltransferase n=1 Tax=Ectobacillus polymachus TaxID=1508806 RepID=UPI003A888857
MFTLEPITKSTLYIIKEIVNSNMYYNECENGRPMRTDDELSEEFNYVNPERKTYFIKADDTYIGLVDYLENNEKDGYPWLGLLMIHGDYHHFGYGTNAYYFIEEMLIKQGKSKLRLGIFKNNNIAKSFWTKMGYTYYETKCLNKGIVVDCYEKVLFS